MSRGRGRSRRAAPRHVRRAYPVTSHYQPCGEDRRVRRHTPVAHQHREGIRAQPVERAVPERDQPGLSGDQVEAEDGDRVRRRRRPAGRSGSPTAGTGARVRTRRARATARRRGSRARAPGSSRRHGRHVVFAGRIARLLGWRGRAGRGSPRAGGDRMTPNACERDENRKISRRGLITVMGAAAGAALLAPGLARDRLLPGGPDGAAEHGDHAAARFWAQRARPTCLLHRSMTFSPSDPTFDGLRQPNAPIQRLWTGALWSEGPAWSSAGALPRVERHPEQPAAPLARGRRPA